jgi:uncharacterized protein YbjT (DUF2867 family)
MAKVLVVGATGQVGGAVALGLAQSAGHHVHALVRRGHENPKAKALTDSSVSIVTGDLTDPTSFSSACEGMDVVITTVTSMPTNADDGLRRVDLEGSVALIEAAENAGVQRFVYTSYSGNLRVPSPLETAKRTCEQRLLDTRMDVVILRPSYFMEVWLGPHLGIDIANGQARVYGSGENKGSYVSASDVAAFAIAAATRNQAGKHIVEMGGPEALSQLDAIKIIGEHAGREMQLTFIPLEALEQQYASATDPLQKTFGALMLGYAKGDLITDAERNAREYGVKLTSLREVLKRQRAQAA